MFKLNKSIETKDKISLITVAYDPYPCEVINLFLKSVLIKVGSFIKEIIVVHNRDRENCIHEYSYNGIRIKHICYIGKQIPFSDTPFYGLHVGLDNSVCDYVLFSDPDIIFLKNEFDEFYLNLYKNYNLNMIGVNHFMRSPYGENFPCGINLLLKRDTLPKKDWLSGRWKISSGVDRKVIIGEAEGFFMASGVYMEEFFHLFPNPKSPIFDCGSYLWLWNLERGGKYITFKHNVYDLSNYFCNNYVSNFCMESNEESDSLLIHFKNSTVRHNYKTKKAARRLLIKQMNSYLSYLIFSK